LIERLEKGPEQNLLSCFSVEQHLLFRLEMKLLAD
jgi:hypothetical protein